MSLQLTLWATDSVTSSPGSAGGRSPCASPVCRTPPRSGPDPVPASPSAPQASEAALSTPGSGCAWEETTPATPGTCGPPSGGSSRSADLQSCLESRLRALTDGRGSPLFALTWRQWDLPSGPPICALRASGRRTSGSGSSGAESGEVVRLTSWPTAIVNDATGSTHCYGRTLPDSSREILHKLPGAAKLTSWPTVSVLVNDGDTTWEARRAVAQAKHGNNGFGLNIAHAAALASWPTSTVALAVQGATRALKKDTGHDQATIAAFASWTTPTTRDWKDSHADLAPRDGTPRHDQLPRQAVLAGWTAEHGPARLRSIGELLTGCSAGMNGGGQLSPAHSRWIMGYPPAWDDCAVTAMQSCPKPPRRSSKR